MKKIILILSAIALTAFALLTLYLSSSLIFDLFGMREKQGHNFVEFVAWANLISSLIYLVSAYGMAFQKRFTTYTLSSVLVLLAVTFVSFDIYVNNGGEHLEKTFGALIFRIGITLVFTSISYLLIFRSKKKLHQP